MKSSKIKHLLCFTIIFLLFCAGNADAKNPLPEFFGVYALYNGKLVELQSHPQSQYAISGMTVMGADVLSQLSGITFPEGTIEFIIFRDSATTFNKIALSKIARIDMEANTAWGGDGTKKRLKNCYHLMSENIYMNVAPLKKMMVRVVPKSTLSPGIWAIKIGSELYDFVVGSEESADCVIRKVGAAGVKYIPCSKDQKTNGKQPVGKSIGMAQHKILGKFGLVVQDLTEELSEQFGYQEGQGVLVVEIEPGSPASCLGIHPGHLIEEVNRKRIHNKDEFVKALAQSKQTKKVLFRVRDGESSRYVAIR